MIQKIFWFPLGPVPGPFPVGVLMRTNITLDESVMSLERNPEAKMIILGDSDFIKNYHFNFNDNQDLFLNNSWSSLESRAENLQPKDSSKNYS